MMTTNTFYKEHPNQKSNKALLHMVQDRAIVDCADMQINSETKTYQNLAIPKMEWV